MEKNTYWHSIVHLHLTPTSAEMAKDLSLISVKFIWIVKRWEGKISFLAHLQDGKTDIHDNTTNILLKPRKGIKF